MLNQNKLFTTLSEAASTVLIKESSEELNLKYFAAYTSGIPFGTLDKIKNVISEYKKNGISPDKLLKEAQLLERSEHLKAIDVASIYKLYLEKCKKLSALEIGDIYSENILLPAERFKESFQSIYPKIQSILIDGFDEFNNLEITIIDKLSEQVDSNISINFDYFENNEILFSHLSTTFIKLIQIGFIESDKNEFEDEFEFRNKIRMDLFNKSERIHSDFENILNKTYAKNRIEEVEQITKTIKELIVYKNAKPEKICVAFNSISNYSSKVRDIFNKYGVPLNLTDRIPLKSSPSVIAAISLLDLIEGDYFYHDIARVVSNGFLNFDSIDLNNLISVASELKITGGKKNWEQIISDNKNLIEFGDNVSVRDQDLILKKYNKALLDIEYIDSLLLPIKKKNTINNFIKLFTKLLLTLKLPCLVLEDSNGREEEHIKALTVLLNTLNEVLALKQRDAESEDQKYPLSFYLEQIRTISNWARFNVKEKSDFGVLVTSLNEIRGLEFDYLFLGGLCDGDFPTKYSPEIFFSGSFRKQEAIHHTEEMYHFYQTLCCWNKELYLSIPQNDKESELVESTFIKDFEALFTLTQVELKPEKKIYSLEELLIEYGTNPGDELLEKCAIENNINVSDIKNRNVIRELRSNNYLENSEYNGFILPGSERTNKYLTEFSEYEFSVSQLEILAKCPFKYFSERILKIQPLEEPTEEAEPIELGSVLHSILYEFYSKIIKDKIPIGAQGTKEFVNLKDILFDIAEEKITKLNLNSPLAFFEKEKILGIDGNKEFSILFKFLQQETEISTSFKPSLFEYSFGSISKRQNSNTNVPIQIDDLKLRGTIDRIDVDYENQFV